MLAATSLEERQQRATVDVAISDAIARAWEPEPEETIPEWADGTGNVELAEVTGNEPGVYRINDRVPYAAEILELLSPSNPTRELCLVKGAQLGFTMALVVWTLFIMKRSPGVMIWVQPTLNALQKFKSEKFDPTIEASGLSHLVTEASAEGISFRGGKVNMTTAKSTSALRSTSARNVAGDEVDEWPGDVGGQGDPVGLLRKRMLTFPNRKAAWISTPTLRDRSRIEKFWRASDQRKYFIPCPECGHMDFLTFSGFGDYLAKKDPGHHHLAWDEGKPETAHMVCGKPDCRARIPEHRKDWMLSRGRWIATSPGPGKMPGFHLPSLYSPIGWLSWKDVVDEFLEVKDDPPRLKVWVNTVLAETYQDTVQRTTWEDLLRPARLERYQADVPHGVGILVGFIDTQDDRLAWQVKGYGAGEESWLIRHGEIAGDPDQGTVWRDADQEMLAEFVHESGRKLRVERFGVDTMGHKTESAYRFCAARESRAPARVYACRGGALKGVPVVGAPTRDGNRYRVNLYTLCTDTAKEIIFSRLELAAAGPGYFHFPEWANEEYFRQLLSEKAVWKWSKKAGRPEREWDKLRARNEVLDLEVGCLSVLYMGGPRLLASLAERAAHWSEPITVAAPDEPEHPQVRVPVELLRRMPRKPWVRRW